MQVLIICGGLATRLHPITEKIPKSMVKIQGKPILHYQIHLLRKQGIKNIILCAGHLSEKIKEYFKDGKRFGVNLIYSYENEPLGTAGAVKNINEKSLENQFFVLYGDIITNVSFKNMLDFHKKNDSCATILIREKNKIGSSLIDLDRNSRILDFIEKPDKEQIIKFKEAGKKIWVNSGLYLLKKSALNYLPGNKKFDFAYDLFPKLLEKNKKLFGFPLDSFWRELGKINRVKSFEKEINNFLNISINN